METRPAAHRHATREGGARDVEELGQRHRHCPRGRRPSTRRRRPRGRTGRRAIASGETFAVTRASAPAERVVRDEHRNVGADGQRAAQGARRRLGPDRHGRDLAAVLPPRARRPISTPGSARVEAALRRFAPQAEVRPDLGRKARRIRDVLLRQHDDVDGQATIIAASRAQPSLVEPRVALSSRRGPHGSAVWRRTVADASERRPAPSSSRSSRRSPTPASF